MLSDETIEDLMIDDLKIIQKKNSFRFGTDAVLLSLFTEIKGKKRVLDIGTGTGIIPILLSCKNKESEFVGIEIQEDIADMASRSILMNRLEDRIRIINCDVNNISGHFGKGTFDIVVTNPPYKKTGTGIHNKEASNAAARHEVFCTLDDIIKKASEILKPGGSFFMVNRPDRLADAIVSMRKYRLEPKLIRFAHSDLSKKPILFLIQACLYGGENLVIGDPIYIDQSLTCMKIANNDKI